MSQIDVKFWARQSSVELGKAFSHILLALKYWYKLENHLVDLRGGWN